MSNLFPAAMREHLRSLPSFSLSKAEVGLLLDEIAELERRLTEHRGRIVGWVRYDGDEYHDFRYQTHDPGPEEVARWTREGFLPLYVGVQAPVGSASPAVAIVRRATADVLGEVAIERVRQDEKWGGPDHDDEHDATDWCRYIEMRLHSSNAGHTTGDSRRWFLEIAALAVAAIETIDRADNNEDGP